jgi:hypothetical protein
MRNDSKMWEMVLKYVPNSVNYNQRRLGLINAEQMFLLSALNISTPMTRINSSMFVTYCGVIPSVIKFVFSHTANYISQIPS